MAQPIRVLIVENDRYARKFMSLLIRRDNRVHIAGEVQQMANARDYFQSDSEIDLIVLGGDQSFSILLSDPIYAAAQTTKGLPRVICAAAHPEQITLALMDHPACQGCLFKSDIQYSLVWALVLAAQGEWVITPGVEGIARNIHFAFNQAPVILNGSHRVAGMTAQEAETARLAFLMYVTDPKTKKASLPPGFSQSIKMAYRKLCFEQILQQKTSSREYFAGQPALLRYFGDQLEQMWDNFHSVHDQASLAFSLLTVPEIQISSTLPR